MGKRRARADHRADTRGGGWGGLPHCVTDSLAYRHLSLWARAVLVELVREMNGYNNGEIALSQRQLAERLRTSNFRRIGRAIAELMEHGLIDVAVEGQWKERQARQYRLTFVNTGKPGSYRPASNEYRDWKPSREKSGVEPVSAKTAKSAEPVSADRPNAAEPVSAEVNGKLPKSPLASAEPVSSLIECHIQAPAGGAPKNADSWFADEAALDLRNKIVGYFHHTLKTAKRQRAWAESFGVSRDDVRTYCNGDPHHLPAAKVAAMVCSIKNEKSAARSVGTRGRRAASAAARP